MLAEIVTPYKTDDRAPGLEVEGSAASTSGQIWLRFARKLLLFFGAIAVIKWLWGKSWWRSVWKMLRLKTGLFKKYGRLPLAFIESPPSWITRYSVFLNRMVGFVAGVIILITDFEIMESSFIALALIIAGVFWHEFRRKQLSSDLSPTRRQIFCFGKDQEIPALVYCITFAVLAWMCWQVVQLSSSQYSLGLNGLILSLVYFYLPWSKHFFGSLSQFQKHPCFFWVAIAGSIYFVAIIALFSGIGLYNFSNIVSLGSLAMIPAWNLWVKDVRPKIESNWPDLAKMVYSTEATQYISGFFVLLVPATLCRVFTLEHFAEQFVILGLYMLIVGLFFKVKELSAKKV